MSSIEELKAVRLFRALNTIIQLCHDRGYVIRHPSAIAHAVRNPTFYSEEEGLDYDWFLRHFVISPERAATSTRNKHVNGGTRGGGSSTNNTTSDMKCEEDFHDADKTVECDEALEESEALRRAANGEWVCMRNAMRLTCSLDPHRAPPSPSRVSGVSVSNKQSATAAPEEDKKSRDMTVKNALMVFFTGAPKLNMKEVQIFREKALKKKAASMIIVTNKTDPSVRMDVQELSGRMDEVTGEELLSIQVFEEESLAFNIVRHETVPRHVPLTPAEAEAFLAERKLSIPQLPRMLESDPLVQYLGLHRGSIVHITREGKQSGPYSMYRHVI